MTMFPGLAIVITVLSSEICLGDGFRDALDPKLRSSGKGGAEHGREKTVIRDKRFVCNL